MALMSYAASVAPDQPAQLRNCATAQSGQELRWPLQSRRGVMDMVSALRPGGHGFDPHRGSVLKISHKDTKYWF
ncbi:hypothetical protein DPMN_104273 [Dreissena polymorpha]|uniref:Uncharacterized protein n=1 Tax=Dreissena polymorpha TaxID=45954 RepID=A0A9D4HCS9_DREPO|nr:hypothetical protein DPMN_104273 [Dreissena polymorpha]